ncbi:putative oxidoreductase YdhV [subsurface metagenome]
MIFGYSGNILHINLSRKNVWIEHPSENFYRTFGGGRGIALFYMLKNMKQNIDPFSEDNLLIFSTGAPVGSMAPGINRYTVCSKSPLTGVYGESQAGGWWGPELKKAGFDAIVIKGKSKNPVYLFINNGKIEIKDASHIWGRNTGIVQEIIKKELGDRLIKILQIGIAGENLVRFSNIVNELSHFNGRNGLGAIMGSKKLKAIAVRGTKAIKIHDKERFKLKVKEINKRANTDPSCQRYREVGTPSSIHTFFLLKLM